MGFNTKKVTFLVDSDTKKVYNIVVTLRRNQPNPVLEPREKSLAKGSKPDEVNDIDRGKGKRPRRC